MVGAVSTAGGYEKGGKSVIKVLLACPNCSFIIAEFTEEQLEADERRRKRYRYLKKKQTLCPNCLTATTKLQEFRGEEAETALAAAPKAEKAVAPTEVLPGEERGTPLCDALEEGAWPSHVTELKKSTYHLAMYEEALRLRQTQWGFGGYVSLPGVAAGILVRQSARPDIAPGANFVRVLPPCGSFYSTETLRTVCDIADKHAYGVLHLHSAGGDIEVLGIPTEDLQPTVKELNEHGLDVGSTGDAYRNTVDCLGMARCDAALVDAMDMRSAWYRRFLDDVQYPRFPHKLKVRFSGCPNDCTRSQQKSCIAIIGVFRDPPKVDDEKLSEWVAEGGDMAHIAMMCPGRAMYWDGQHLEINQEACLHCMYCINKCPYAIRPGDDRGVAVQVGGKLRGKYGPLMTKVLAPFVPANPPDYPEVMDLVDRIADVFDEHARRKERMGDFLFRVGMDQFIRWVGVEPTPQQMVEPRINVFYHWEAEELAVS
jgi:sulfite reductase alpha subunit